MQLASTAGVVLLTVVAGTRFLRLIPADSGIATEQLAFVYVRDDRFKLIGFDRRIDPLVDEVLLRLRAMPDIRAAAVSDSLPIGPGGGIGGVAVPGSDRTLDVRVVRVGSGYAGTVGLQLLRGSIADFDGLSGNSVFIDEVLARKLGDSGIDAVRMTSPTGASQESRFLVRGVVRRVIHETTRGPQGNMFWQPASDPGLLGGEFPTVYVPYDGFTDPTFILSSPLPADVLAQRVEQVWRQLSPSGRVKLFLRADEALAPLLAKDRSISLIFAFGSGVLLLIVAAAMFGTLATALPIRQHHAAIELAIGATPRRLLLRELGRAVVASVAAVAFAFPLVYLVVAMTGEGRPMGAAEITQSVLIGGALLSAVCLAAVLPMALRIAGTHPGRLMQL